MINPQGVRVPFVDLPRQHQLIKQELLEVTERVLDHGQFVLGPEVEEFESQFSSYCGSKYAVGVDNGTNALLLTLKALGVGIGDEVITPANSFLASTSCVVLAGANPSFVDVGSDYNIDPNKLEDAITTRTRAIIAVHLTGRPADMDSINQLAEIHSLFVIEDAAQAVGARYRGRSVGSLGTAACFSFHPLKNLNAAGDGGIITTSDFDLQQKLVKLRNHGLRGRDELETWGYNSRLDALHAAMLNVKLRYVDEWTAKRRSNANFYINLLDGVVGVPREREEEFSVYQTFRIEAERRDELKGFLSNAGIDTAIHYSVPVHLQEAARDLGYKKGDLPVTESQAEKTLSLPIYPELDTNQKEAVVAGVNAFYG